MGKPTLNHHLGTKIPVVVLKSMEPWSSRIITSVVPPSLPMQMAFAVNTALMSLMKPLGVVWEDVGGFFWGGSDGK